MVYEQRQQAAVSDVLAWIEDELRETKAHVGRLRTDFDQATGRIAELASDLYSVQDGTKAVATRLDELPPSAQLINHVRERLVEAEERATAADQRLTEGLRLQQIEVERLRQELNGTYRRIELLERATEGWSGRFDRLDDADHFTQEGLALLRQRFDELERRQETAEARTTRSSDSFKRLEHELGQLSAGIDGLQSQQTLVGERAQVFGELIKRAQDRIDSVAAEVTSQTEIFEKLDLLQAELHRIENRVAAAEAIDNAQYEQLDEHQRQLGLLDGKDRGLASRLTHLQEDLAAYRAQVAEQFQRIHQALDRQKRRQIEDLEHDLRELKHSAFRASEDRE
jgi:chromosome segregation ATPase